MSKWQDIKDAPFQTVIEVRNPRMDHPVRATRGFMTDIGMHPDDTLCTSRPTTTPGGAFWPAGRMIAPTQFRIPDTPQDQPAKGEG